MLNLNKALGKIMCGKYKKKVTNLADEQPSYLNKQRNICNNFEGEKREYTINDLIVPTDIVLKMKDFKKKDNTIKNNINLVRIKKIDQLINKVFYSQEENRVVGNTDLKYTTCKKEDSIIDKKKEFIMKKNEKNKIMDNVNTMINCQLSKYNIKVYELVYLQNLDILKSQFSNMKIMSQNIDEHSVQVSQKVLKYKLAFLLGLFVDNVYSQLNLELDFHEISVSILQTLPINEWFSFLQQEDIKSKYLVSKQNKLIELKGIFATIPKIDSYIMIKVVNVDNFILLMNFNNLTNINRGLFITNAQNSTQIKDCLNFNFKLENDFNSKPSEPNNYEDVD
jgi:hypothetical protein